MRVRAERRLGVARKPHRVAEEERVRVGTAGHVGSSAPDIVGSKQLVQEAHLERHRLHRRHAAAVARGPVPAADLQAEARRRRDGVARLLDVLGHSCAVEGAQVCFARDYDAKQERWWHRALL